MLATYEFAQMGGFMFMISSGRLNPLDRGSLEDSGFGVSRIRPNPATLRRAVRSTIFDLESTERRPFLLVKSKKRIALGTWVPDVWTSLFGSFFFSGGSCDVAVGQNHWYHSGVGVLFILEPILVGIESDVHWG